MPSRKPRLLLHYVLNSWGNVGIGHERGNINRYMGCLVWSAYNEWPKGKKLDVARRPKVRGLQEGQAAISPPTFPDIQGVDQFRKFSQRVRDLTGGIPVGFKIAASHIEDDIAFALEAGADYIILDGRGGGTGAAPTVLRDNINVPTIPALARARRFLDNAGAHDISLVSIAPFIRSAV